MGSRALRVGSLADHDPGSPFQLIDSIRKQIENVWSSCSPRPKNFVARSPRSLTVRR
jgi:hypothetical protein